MNKSDRIRVGEQVTIYRRGRKQTWCADFWRDGAHCRQSLKTANQKVALRRAMELETQLTAGTYRKPPPAISVRQAAEDYVNYLKTEGRSRRTLVKYKGIFDVLATFLESHSITRLAQFSPTLFDKFRAWRKSDHHRKTMYIEGIVVKQLFKWAKSRKLLIDNPVADYRLDKPPLEPKAGPGLEQFNCILAALPQPQRTPVAVLGFTGMRAGELQRLQPPDLDLTGNWIVIASRQGLETKTGLSRKVPIHGCLRPLLEALSRQQQPWVFTQPPSPSYPAGNQPLNIKKLNERFQQAVRDLGLPTGRKQGGFTLHSLRHFFETFTVNAGIPQRVVDTWLGHRSDRSMAAVYYKLTDADSQAFMKKVPLGTGALAADASQTEG